MGRATTPSSERRRETEGEGGPRAGEDLRGHRRRGERRGGGEKPREAAGRGATRGPTPAAGLGSGGRDVAPHSSPFLPRAHSADRYLRDPPPPLISF